MVAIYQLLLLTLPTGASSSPASEETLSNETDILSFVLAEQTSEPDINAVEHIVKIEVVKGTDVSFLAPSFTLSLGATSSPASGETVDFTQSPITYTLTAEDGITTQNWSVIATEALNTETDILTFELVEQTREAVINATDHSITIEVAFDTDITSLAPVLTLSEGATSDPVSGEITDFTNAVTYTVDAEDGVTSQEWVVTLIIAGEPLSSETDVLTFVLAEQTGDAVINATDHTVSIEVVFGTDVSTLSPTLTLSEGATSSIASGASFDFNNPVTYTITAEDGTTAQDWIVTVTKADEEPETDTAILTFVLAEQTGAATINTTDHTVSIEVTFGTNVSVLTPTFTLSEGATSSIVSGAAVDFSNSVTYTITAEDGETTQEWVIEVTIAEVITSVDLEIDL